MTNTLMNQFTQRLNLRESLFLGLAIFAFAFAFLSKRNLPQPSGTTGDEISLSGENLAQSESSADRSPMAEENGAESPPADHPEVEMTPEQAKKLFEDAASITNIYDQARVYRETIKGLCEAGYAKEAWQMIFAEPGYNRDSQLAAFFISAPMDFEACVEKIATLRDSSEKKSALEGYLGGNIDQYPEILDKPDFERITQELMRADPNALVDILGDAMLLSFGRAGDDAERDQINQYVLDLHSRGQISDADFSGMIARNLSKGPFELWSWLADSSMGVDDPQGSGGEMREGIVRGMVMANAPEALSKISSNTGESAVYDLYQGVSAWASKNPKAANEWYLEHSPQLTQAQQDAAAKAFANLAISYQELEGAENWADQISDEIIRNSVLEKIHPPLEQEP